MRIISLGFLFASVIPLLLGQAVLAGGPQAPEKLKALLKQSRRPTIAEIMNLFPKGLPDDVTTNKWLGTDPAFGEGEHENLIEGLGQLVGELETTYPDARYATLGRDAVYAADLLEAYYLALGQTDRVKRIHVSTPACAASSGALGRMLLTVGLDFNPRGRRFVLLDRTSYNPGGSQSFVVMTAASEILKKHGMSDKQIWNKLGVGSSQTGRGVGNFEALKKFLDGQAQMADGDLPVPSLVHIGALANYVDVAGEWHNTYALPLVRYDNGEIGGTISRASNFPENHPGIVATQIAIMRTVFSNINKIVQKAKKCAADHGYSYSPRAAKNRRQLPPIFADVRLHASQILGEHIRDSIDETMKNPEAHRQEVEAIANERSAAFAQEYSEASDKKITDSKILKAYDDWWGKASAPYRALLERPRRSDITNLGVQLAIDLVPTTQAEHDKQGSYFSSNGKALYQFLKQIHSAGEGGASGALETLALSAIAEGERKISARDLRRLTLFALSTVEENASAFYENLPKVLDHFPELKSIFESRSEVFLTSERYEGAAKPVFEKLMKLGIIDAARAKKNCSKVLEAKKEEDDAA